MKHRLAIVTTHVIQYQDPMFKWIAAHPDIDLTVFYCSRDGLEPFLDPGMGVKVKWDLELLQGYRHVFLPNYSPGLNGFLKLVNPGIFSALRRGRFDAVIVAGWNSASTWFAFAACRALGIPYFIYGDNSFVPEPSSARARMREAVIRRLFAGAGAFLSMGTMNSDYFRYYGARDEQIFLVPFAIDTDRFGRESTLSPAERRAIRARLGIDPDRVVILFPNKLIQRKNPMHLLEALERMEHRDRVSVVFMGDGSERARVEARIRERGLANVHLLGFVNQTEIPRIYGISDIMVLPSSFDPRGIVTAEAMACGLPVVISDMVATYGPGDILRPGENGFVYPVGDNAEFARILDRLVADPEERRAMGERSREIIQGFGFEQDVQGVLGALNYVRTHRAGAMAEVGST